MSGTYWDNHLSKDVLGHSTLQDAKAVLIGGSEVKARMFWAIDRMLIFACAPRPAHAKPQVTHDCPGSWPAVPVWSALNGTLKRKRLATS